MLCDWFERQRREPHRQWNNNAENLPDNDEGRVIVTASGDDLTARVWATTAGAEAAVFVGPKVRLEELGGKYSADRSRIIWESNDLIGAHSCAAFSPDGTRIVATLKDRTPRLLDAITGKELGIYLRGHERMVHSVTFSPDGTRIVTASSDHSARIWDGLTGKEIVVLRAPKVVKSAAFSPDGSRVVTVSTDDTARIWDTTTGMMIGSLKTTGLESVAFNPEGSQIVTASEKTARFWNIKAATLSTEQLIAEVCLRRQLGLTTLSRDEIRLAGYSNSTDVIDVCTGIE